MRALSASEIIRIWEIGRGQSALDRALTILAIAAPERKHDDWAMLAIGARDAWLFAARERAFGPKIDALLDCPDCANRLEVEMETGQLCAPAGLLETSELRSACADGYAVRFRLPNSHDLAAVGKLGRDQSLEEELLKLCVESAHCGESEVPFEQVPDSVREAVVESMEQCDPRLEIEITLCCPACGHTWQAIFDIASFLWSEICARAQRLLREVHALASAYGWSEVDILALTPQRRQFYLEMVRG